MSKTPERDSYSRKEKSVSRDKYERLKKKAYEWQESAQRYKQTITALEEELSDLAEEEKNGRKALKKIKDEETTLLEKMSKMERDIILKDGKIQQLEDAKNDLSERYKELKEDFRESQRWNREGTRTKE